MATDTSPDFADIESLQTFGRSVHADAELIGQDFFETMLALLSDKEQEILRQNRVEREARQPSAEVGFYDYYPFFFAGAFPDIPLDQMRLLCEASRFCLDFLVAADKIIDGQVKDSWSVDRAYVVLRTGLLQQHAMVRFAQLFGQGSPFWDYLHRYYMAYAEAVFAEQALHVGQPRPYPWEEMSRIAAGKTAMAKSIPTAMALLSGREVLIPDWCRSLDLCSVAYQLLDDLRDWKEDYASQTYSYLLIRALESGELTAAVEAGEMPPEKMVGQYIYFTGLAESLLHRAHDLYNQALEAVSVHPSPSWSAHVVNLQRHNWRLRADLWEIREQTILKQLRKKVPSRQPIESTTLEDAINAALDFVCTSQLPEGHWIDWGLTVGSAREYATACVGRALVDARDWPHPRLTETLEKAGRWLLGQQQESGGWGWHQELAADADTTANSLLFLAQLEMSPVEALDAARRYLLANQNPKDGGMRTYRLEHIAASLQDGNFWWPRIPLENYRGWLSSTTSLTALAIQALLYLDRPDDKPALGRMLDYLAATQDEDGSWPAYWWRGRSLSSHAALVALVMAGEKARASRAAAWFLRQQRDDGSWGDEEEAKGRPLHTALALQALLVAGERGEAAARGFAWLLERQQADGSWAPSPMLLVPDPDELRPWLPGARCQGRGMDENRLFTTAAVLRALLEKVRAAREDLTAEPGKRILTPTPE